MSVESIESNIIVQIVFWISAAVYTLGAVTFILIGSADEQRWNRTNHVMSDPDVTTSTKYESFTSSTSKIQSNNKTSKF